MKVTITKIKDTPRTSKTSGKPYTSRGILTNEYGGRWLSGFAGKENESWKEGDTVDITIEEKGEYLNFTVPKAEKAPQGDLLRVERKIDAILAECQWIRGNMSQDNIPSSGEAPEF